MGLVKQIETDIHDALREMGCCISLFVYGEPDTPADIHHIVEGGRRLGHQFVIPLAPIFHRQGTELYPSLHSVNGSHGGRSLFKETYGYDEYQLLAKCEEYLDWEYSKI